MSDYIAEIQSVFLKLHGCDAEYVETVPVVEEFQGETIWQGDVEVFNLRGHPKATRWLWLGICSERRRRAALLHCVGIAASRFTGNGGQNCDTERDRECEKKEKR
jgi:hypothetical protein